MVRTYVKFMIIDVFVPNVDLVDAVIGTWAALLAGAKEIIPT